VPLIFNPFDTKSRGLFAMYSASVPSRIEGVSTGLYVFLLVSCIIQLLVVLLYLDIDISGEKPK